MSACREALQPIGNGCTPHTDKCGVRTRPRLWEGCAGRSRSCPCIAGSYPVPEIPADGRCRPSRAPVNGRRQYSWESAQDSPTVSFDNPENATELDWLRQEAAARADAFLAVPLYQRIYDHYKGYTLPGPAAIEKLMRDVGVSSKVAD